MKERPILFSGPMVRALLEGRKTVTRRVVRDAKPLAPDVTDFGYWVANDAAVHEEGVRFLRCPYGQPGDRLWVKETVRWAAAMGRAFYAADKAPSVIDNWPWQRRVLPSIHLPRGASRITLEVTNVRVERLHDITEEDIEAEGVELSPDGVSAYYEEPNGCGGQLPTAREAFEHLWSVINGAASWKANPWVWRVAFRRIG